MTDETHPELQIEYRAPSDLVPYINNAKQHEPAQIDQISASIKEFGFTNPILLDGDNGVIAGHGRLMAANKLKLEQVPTIELGHLTVPQKKAYILADNRLSEVNTSWDFDLVSTELESLQLDDFDIELTGFDDGFILDEPEEGLTDEDAVPDAPDEPVTVLGDIWVMGEHRLMCGDSTSIDAVEALVGGASIDMVYTDPPYGINEKGDRTARGTANSLVQSRVAQPDFKDDTIQYAIDAYGIAEGVLQIPRQVWWGANYYCHHLPQSNNWFIWDKRVEEKQRDKQSDCEMAWVKSQFSSIRIFRHLWKGLMKDSEKGSARVHPTQKPVALAEWALDYFKNVGAVIDFFGGSGSTLIACEKTKRSAFVMELDEYYCDVIVDRWQAFTGKTATLENDGRTFDEIKAERVPSAEVA